MAKNEVAVQGQYTRKDVPELLDTIKGKIAALKGTGKKTKNTAGITVPMFGSTLDNINDLSTLIKIDSMIQAKSKAYKASVKGLGVDPKKAPEFEEEGVTAAKWREDIKVRYTEVAFKDELANLEKAKALLEENLSQEDKFSNDMAKIMSGFQD